MFSFAILRTGIIHIINHKSSNGKYTTNCAKLIIKKDCVNILSADNTFPGICSECKSIYEARYKYLVKHNPATTHNMFYDKYYDLLILHKLEVIGPKDSYEDYFDREWLKIKKYKRLLKK
jgi:hypothetical protein